MAVKTYDPNAVIVTVGGFVMSGFADGTAIQAARNEDAWSTQIGVDGEGTRSKSNNRSGTITISLMQSSDSNQVLSNFALTDDASGGGAVPVMIKDGNGDTLLVAETAWVKKMADVEYSREAGAREWVLETDNLVMNVGGN